VGKPSIERKALRDFGRSGWASRYDQSKGGLSKKTLSPRPSLLTPGIGKAKNLVISWIEWTDMIKGPFDSG
jgi:hypothetical protein